MPSSNPNPTKTYNTQSVIRRIEKALDLLRGREPGPLTDIQAALARLEAAVSRLEATLAIILTRLGEPALPATQFDITHTTVPATTTETPPDTEPNS